VERRDLKFEARIHCRTDVQTAWRFLADPRNIPRWYRSVESVVMKDETPDGLGTTFDTIGPASSGKEGLRTPYRVVLIEENTRADIAVIASNVFSSKHWRMELARGEDGVWVTFQVEHQLKGIWKGLAPLLMLMKPAILRTLGRDLGRLRDELERTAIAA
jgi:hypothetical protein